MIVHEALVFHRVTRVMVVMLAACGGETSGVDGGSDATNDTTITDATGGDAKDAATADAIADVIAELPPCQCAAGLTCCNSQCVNLNTDPKNCGGCNSPCPDACVNASCK